MPLNVELAIDDPIVTFCFKEPFDSETIETADSEARRLLKQMGEIYLLLDIRELDLAIPEFMEQLRGAPIILVNEHIIPLVINRAPVTDSPYPVFTHTTDATLYAQKTIAENRGVS